MLFRSGIRENLFFGPQKQYENIVTNEEVMTSLFAYNVGGPGTSSWTAVPQWERYRYVDPILRRAAQLRALETPETAIPTATTTTPVISQTVTPIPPEISTPTPTPPAVLLLVGLILVVGLKGRL